AHRRSVERVRSRKLESAALSSRHCVGAGTAWRDCSSLGRNSPAAAKERARMSSYILRRLLYAIPIVIGVNIITFVLFFFVNSPDQVARNHLDRKRATLADVEKWKREHGYDLPYFYNRGWQQTAVREIKASGWAEFGALPQGTSRVSFELPD